jgi:hypothetical protein
VGVFYSHLPRAAEGSELSDRLGSGISGSRGPQGPLCSMPQHLPQVEVHVRGVEKEAPQGGR